MWDVTITPLLGPSVPTGDPHGITPFWAFQQVPAGDPQGLVNTPPISGWAMTLISFITTHSNDTISSAFGSPKLDFGEVIVIN
jgi:hypothetical protein